MVSPAPPAAAITVEKCQDPEKLHQDIKNACRHLLDGWDALLDEQIEVLRKLHCPCMPSRSLLHDPSPARPQTTSSIFQISFISGGISNALYKVAPSASIGIAPVAFR